MTRRPGIGEAVALQGSRVVLFLDTLHELRELPKVQDRVFFIFGALWLRGRRGGKNENARAV